MSPSLPVIDRASAAQARQTPGGRLVAEIADQSRALCVFRLINHGGRQTMLNPARLELSGLRRP